MLSRTMGPEIGGAVGALFYFANVVCCALYVTACVEGLLNSFGADTGAFVPEDGAWGLPQGRWWNLLYCSTALVQTLGPSCLRMGPGASHRAGGGTSSTARGSTWPTWPCALWGRSCLGSLVLAFYLWYPCAVLGSCPHSSWTTPTTSPTMSPSTRTQPRWSLALSLVWRTQTGPPSPPCGQPTSTPTTCRTARITMPRLTSSLCLVSYSLVSPVSWLGPTCLETSSPLARAFPVAPSLPTSWLFQDGRL